MQNDAKCKQLGWRCIPLVVETYGAWGAEAIDVFSTVASRLVVQTNPTKSRALATLYGRLSMILVRANAGAILMKYLVCFHQNVTHIAVCGQSILIDEHPV